MDHGTGWTLATGDQIINVGKTLLYGFVMLSTDGEGILDIYEGLDATSGRLILGIIEESYPMPVVMFNKPLRLDRGLFVDFGSKTQAVLLQWDAVKDGDVVSPE